MPQAGTIPFAESRESTAIALAGLLAEHGVRRIALADPRFCATRDLIARETDLPRVLLESCPGTTLSLGAVALLIDETVLRWAGDGPLAEALARLNPQQQRVDPAGPPE